MLRLLVIDDEVIFHTLVTRALEGHEWEISTAENGLSGLSLARALKPDLIISDVMMPDITGYEVVRSLRRESEFAETPILMLTAQAGLQDKLKAFEAGADEYLTKPFEPAELLARVTVLLRRAKLARASRAEHPAVQPETARLIAIHSLRGGTGGSSLAVNLALGLRNLWQKETLLLDLTMMAGQVALMLNAPLRRTWADIARFGPTELDLEAVTSIISHHESGLDFIAAPTNPSEAESITYQTFEVALRMLKNRYQYIVADLPHDFQEITLQALDLSSLILLVASPDMASIRASAAALDTYHKLGYPAERIKLLINATFPRLGLQHEKIASALGLPVSVIIPYTPDLFVEAINAGKPFILQKPAEAVSALIEDYAFHISKPEQKKSKPENPSATWQRVYKRYIERRK
jgi:pilus assembly protein CpaE